VPTVTDADLLLGNLAADSTLAGGVALDAEAAERAIGALAEELGLDPGPELQQLETALLGPALGPRTTVDLARTLALAGGEALVGSRRDRLDAALAAERDGDPELTARVVGAYDVPAVWSRADDPAQARAVVAVARRTLARVDDPVLRARLLATVAVESRGLDARAEALEAEAIARAQGDPALLAFALNGVFMQSFWRTGLAPERDAVGAELVGLGLPAYAILGHLVRLQSARALGEPDRAEEHARAAEELGRRWESPQVAVFTAWSRARTAEEYAAADALLARAGMPGMHAGLLGLALASLGRHDADAGPCTPWLAPLALLARGREDDARAALAGVPDPPRDHLQEALWCLVAQAAERLGEATVGARARDELRPARAEHAAGSGVLDLGPVERWL
jgi:hypothetical protein